MVPGCRLNRDPAPLHGAAVIHRLATNLHSERPREVC
jgi:hypothetical protein